ncbi:hypothetical protein [Caballeronia sp. LZ032]|uniref:hypothetical protein n=1 Tax=Caballeronia sp. LZ032 TaxID=3038565 RepID=UPI00285F588F|nr:hypothetical protein [Caballeronia sp. LZ032]MDR5881082.1 hypothetical protein [Caballeronia sp. LZ032]
MSTHKYKGHTIDVWVKKLGSRYDWEFKAGDLPLRRNSGFFAPSEAVAEEEALSLARRMLDQMIERGHG